MLVEDLMSRHPTSCRTENNLAELAEIMWKQRCGTLPVLDGFRKVVGIITDRDICIALGTRNVKASEVLAGDVAVPRCFTCHPEDGIRDALRTMAAEQVSRLPVVDNADQLVGVLSIDDIVFRAGGGRSDLSDREIINSLRALSEDRIHQLPPEESNVQLDLRQPLNYPHE